MMIASAQALNLRVWASHIWEMDENSYGWATSLLAHAAEAEPGSAPSVHDDSDRSVTDSSQGGEHTLLDAYSKAVTRVVELSPGRRRPRSRSCHCRVLEALRPSSVAHHLTLDGLFCLVVGQISTRLSENNDLKREFWPYYGKRSPMTHKIRRRRLDALEQASGVNRRASNEVIRISFTGLETVTVRAEGPNGFVCYRNTGEDIDAFEARALLGSFAQTHLRLC
jgi:hypothetical protein